MIENQQKNQPGIIDNPRTLEKTTRQLKQKKNQDFGATVAKQVLLTQTFG